MPPRLRCRCLVPLLALQSQECWAILGSALSASICISGDPNLALFCPSLAQNQQHVAETGFASALFVVCLCALVLRVMFLLNVPCAAPSRGPAGTSLLMPGQSSNSLANKN